MPGMLPVISRFCVEQAIRTGLSASRPRSTARMPFRPEELFLSDLPQGYQISQFAHPIVGEGRD